MTQPISEPTDNHHDGFFALDARNWARVCGLGLNPAVAYLVLARGSGRDNRTSAWSVNAIEKYAGVSRGRANTALQQLIAAGAVEQLRGGTYPKYGLKPAANVPGALTPAHSPTDAALVERIKQGYKVRYVTRGPRVGEYDAAKRLREAGVLRGNDGIFEVVPPLPAEPDWIWLPNSIIDGLNSATAPVARLREAQDVMLLRLFVDLYHGQHLGEHGGVSPQFIYVKFERERVGEQGPYVVWGFRRQNVWVTWEGFTRCHRHEAPADEAKQGDRRGVYFFSRLEMLEALHLSHWVPHLMESDQLEAMVIHPYGLGGGEALEDAIGVAAHQAGEAMLTPGQMKRVEDHGLRLVPVIRHIASVQMVGILRMRHRPHTRVTSAWWAKYNEEGKEHLQRYLALKEKASAGGW